MLQSETALQEQAANDKLPAKDRMAYLDKIERLHNLRLKKGTEEFDMKSALQYYYNQMFGNTGYSTNPAP